MRSLLSLTAALVILTSSANSADNAAEKQDAQSSAHMAHENYVTAINSNSLDSVLEMLTDDVVFLVPNSPVLEGKEAIAPWIDGYLKAFKTHWEKSLVEFVECGEWAFERYLYKSTDTSLADGSVFEDTGWGLLIYHHDADGKWRVARDSWGQDHPPTK